MNTIIFEREMLHRFYGNCPSDISEILAEYLADQRNMLENLSTSFQTGLESLRENVHYYASIFTYVGFPQLSMECMEFERKCKNINNLELLQPSFNSLLAHIIDSTEIVKMELDDLMAKTNFLTNISAA